MPVVIFLHDYFAVPWHFPITGYHQYNFMDLGAEQKFLMPLSLPAVAGTLYPSIHELKFSAFLLT